MSDGQLGSLVVSLSADIARFQADMGKATKASQDAANQMVREFKNSNDQIAKMFEGTFSGIGKAFAGATAILAGGAMFKDMIGTTKEVTGEIVKLKNSFGISAQQASVLRVALDDVFLNADDMAAASSRITKQLLKNEEAFKNLGVATRDNKGNFRSTIDIMTETNSKLMEFREGTDRNVEGMKIYGKGWEEARKTLKLTAEGMIEAKKRADELHLVIGDDMIKSMKDYKLAMKDLDDVHESFKVSIGTKVIPPLTKVAVLMGDVGVTAAEIFADSTGALVNVIDVMIAEQKIRMSKFKLWIDDTFGSADLASYSQLRARQLAIAAQEGMVLSGGPKFGTEDHLMNMGRLANPKQIKGEHSKGADEAKKEAEKWTLANDLLFRNMKEYAELMKKQEEQFYQLGQNMQDTADGESRAFKLLTGQNGELKADRYKVTPLKDYRMMTMKQYSIPQSFDPEIEIKAIEKLHDEMIAQYDDIRKASPWAGLEEGMLSYSENVKDLKRQFEDLASNTMNNMENALTSFVMTGKGSFKDMANSIISDLIRIQIRASITGPLASALGGLAGSMFSGGTVDNYNPFNTYAGDSPGPWLAGARANGGPVSAGQSYLVGERGPEIFTPSTYGGITSNSQLRNSAAPVTIVMNNQSGQSIKAKETGSSFDGKSMVKTIVLEAMDTDPTFRWAMRGAQ